MLKPYELRGGTWNPRGVAVRRRRSSDAAGDDVHGQCGGVPEIAGVKDTRHDGSVRLPPNPATLGDDAG